MIFRHNYAYIPIKTQLWVLYRIGEADLLITHNISFNEDLNQKLIFRYRHLCSLSAVLSIHILMTTLGHNCHIRAIRVQSDILLKLSSSEPSIPFTTATKA